MDLACSQPYCNGTCAGVTGTVAQLKNGFLLKVVAARINAYVEQLESTNDMQKSTATRLVARALRGGWDAYGSVVVPDAVRAEPKDTAAGLHTPPLQLYWVLTDRGDDYNVRLVQAGIAWGDRSFWAKHDHIIQWQVAFVVKHRVSIKLNHDSTAADR